VVGDGTQYVKRNLDDQKACRRPELYAKVFSTPLESVRVTRFFYYRDILSMDVEAKSGPLTLKQVDEYRVLDPRAAAMPERFVKFDFCIMREDHYKTEPWVRQIFFRPLFYPDDISADPEDPEKLRGIWICLDAAQTKAHVYCNRVSMLLGKR
jgi:hypothetical protein